VSNVQEIIDQVSLFASFVSQTELIISQWKDAELHEIKRILENMSQQEAFSGVASITVHGIKNLPDSKTMATGTFHSVIKWGGCELMRMPEISGHAPSMWQPKPVRS
jgi:hypothetical protein